jgi:hypothetical protein
VALHVALQLTTCTAYIYLDAPHNVIVHRPKHIANMISTEGSKPPLIAYCILLLQLTAANCVYWCGGVAFVPALRPLLQCAVACT